MPWRKETDMLFYLDVSVLNLCALLGTLHLSLYFHLKAGVSLRVSIDFWGLFLTTLISKCLTSPALKQTLILAKNLNSDPYNPRLLKTRMSLRTMKHHNFQWELWCLDENLNTTKHRNTESMRISHQIITVPWKTVVVSKWL